MDGAKDGLDLVLAEVRAAASEYCVSLHRCDAQGLAKVFAPGSHLYAAGADGIVALPRDAWLAAVAGRVAPVDEAPDYAVELIDASGPQTALARVSVRVGAKRFTDYLNFLKVDGEWKVIAKVYRQTEGPTG